MYSMCLLAKGNIVGVRSVQCPAMAKLLSIELFENFFDARLNVAGSRLVERAKRLQKQCEIGWAISIRDRYVRCLPLAP